MPLYTYIVSYRGATEAVQGRARAGNYKGSAALVIGEISDNALPGLTKQLRTEMIEKTYRAEWLAIPNRGGVWRTSFDVGGSELALYAIQTEVSN
ncbi:MAG TPA: hypothetical protein VKS60_14805 [Stellaceae bacterium]|nr:hypothetical protein [Stellaceae bacterium]